MYFINLFRVFWVMDNQKITFLVAASNTQSVKEKLKLKGYSPLGITEIKITRKKIPVNHCTHLCA
jgi:hypothetical protein